MRRLVALAAAALLAIGLPPALAGGPAYARTDRMVTVHDGPDGHHVARLDTTTWVPTGHRPAAGWPVILMTHGFGLSKDAAEVTSTADFFARHGYLVLTWTSQGFGNSSGCIQLDSWDYDVTDVSRLIDQLIEPRHDVRRDGAGRPVIGMLGGSYAGGLTMLAAERDPRIRAIAPGRAWQSLQHALMPNDRIVPGQGAFALQAPTDGVFKAEWTSLLFASGNAQPIGGLPPSGGPHGGCLQEKAAAHDPGDAACPNFPDEMCTAFARIATTGSLDPTTRALLARSSPATWLDRLTVPTLLVQGESDTLFNIDEAVATYQDLKRRHVPVAMIWNSGGHGGYDSQPGECDVYGGGTTGLDDCYLPQRTLAWFDHWLKGADTSTGPGFAYYRDWVPYAGHGPDTGQYGTAASFPAQHGVALVLSGRAGDDMDLVPPGYAVEPGIATFYRAPAPTSYSETSEFTGGSGPAHGVPAGDLAATYVQFTTAPLTSPVVSVGVPTAHLHLSHLGTGDLILFAKVYDVAPDGTQTLVHRLVAPVRVPTAALSRAVDLRLPGFAHRFAVGHRIRLVLSATDASYDLGAAGATPDQVSVQLGDPDASNGTPYDSINTLRGGKDPSTFTLPVNDPRALFPGPAGG